MSINVNNSVFDSLEMLRQVYTFLEPSRKSSQFQRSPSMELPHQRIHRIEYKETLPRCRPHCGASLRLVAWSWCLIGHSVASRVPPILSQISKYSRKTFQRTALPQALPLPFYAFLCISMPMPALIQPQLWRRQHQATAAGPGCGPVCPVCPV